MSTAKPPARTYNQEHVKRPYTPGKRRISIYWTWSYPWESNRDVTELDNRFSTITEVRRVAWPSYETPEFSERMFLQGIAGTLELFHLSTIRFQSLAEEVTGHPVAVYQRIDQAGQKLPIDERIRGRRTSSSSRARMPAALPILTMRLRGPINMSRLGPTGSFPRR